MGDTASISVTCLVGQEPTTSLDFRLYPNPTSGEFWLEGPGNGESFSVQITDLSGKIVERREHQSGAIRFDLSTYPAGMYLVTAVYHDRRWNQRVILR